MGGNPAEAHPVSLQHLLEGNELNKANFIVIDPRLTRTAAHATEYVRIRPGTDIPVLWGMLWHMFKNGWEDKEFIKQRVYGMDDARKEIEKWTPEVVESISGVPGAQLERVAKMFATQKPSTLIWCMGQTQHTVGTANVRASCIALLATGNVGAPGTGANIFRGHDNVQGATDIGLDVVTLPFYYGLVEGAWKHWSARLGGRLQLDPVGRSIQAAKKMMETPGIPLTRWFDAVLLPKDQVAPEGQHQGDVRVQGHASNSITRIPESIKGMAALDLLVVADPHPTTWASLAANAGRKDNIYLLPICTQFESIGSRVASNRSLQWGEQIVKPIFESKDDLRGHLPDGQEVRLRRQDVQEHQGRRQPCRWPRTCLREMNRGSFSTGYCGQSPERLKAHMKHQAEFDLVTMRAAKGRPKSGGDYYGLPWPCWGTPEVKHPGTPLLYNTNQAVMDGGGCFRARFGVEREEKKADGSTVKVSLLADGSYSKDSEIKDGYPRIHRRRAQEARLGQGPDRSRVGGDQQDQPGDPDAVSWSIDLSGGVQRVCHEAWLRAVRQRQGAHECLRPAGSDPGAPRADLLAAHRPCRQISDPARCQAVPAAQYRLLGAEGRGRQGHRQAVPAHPLLRPAGRIRRRRRGNPVQQVAGRAAAGHVRRDQHVRRRRARHQGRRLGLGHRRREQPPRPR